MQTIGFLVHPSFHMLSLGALSAFEFANRTLPEPAYEVVTVSMTGGLVRSCIGVDVDTVELRGQSFDTLMIAGAPTIVPFPPRLVEHLKDATARHRRVVSICTGAFVLAEAGLLDGRRATTHWFHARELADRFPAVKVEQDRIFIADGPIWTSAGASAAIDLALALVEQDHGVEIARAVARKLVVYHRRPGGQSQFSELLDIAPKSDRIQRALTYARRNLQTELSVTQLAKVASLSPRQFSRAFLAETGQPPAKIVERLRVEAARLLMEQSRHPIDVIARQTGFADRDRMRRAFLRAFGQPPQAIRRSGRSDPIDIAESAVEA
ncbi:MULTISPECIES: GlxA family transcriptional regulator [Rhizobium]|uniref:Transcriptional regulator GlxA family, contains an amidase domain and an AraC-type DNA-binding HTH domain n=1 Tax=Rhizobium miluonense TaxID=411945 RepID=A0A1C3X3W0_9HYPH|nr:GlxA family transcriptional regulator [Rhizobium miluonense]SCB46826.1 Transcriptional regulator GlxA family, contains an amidase domain and an AraC-type DNA-binding HTH domain [Rhizobium miluonense]